MRYYANRVHMPGAIQGVHLGDDWLNQITLPSRLTNIYIFQYFILVLQYSVNLRQILYRLHHERSVLENPPMWVNIKKPTGHTEW